MTDPQQQAMPPLPEPTGVIVVGTQAMRAFTADQVTAYAAEAVARALAAQQQPKNQRAAELMLLIGQYWDIAWQEGANHSVTDRDGKAQKKLAQIYEAVRTLAASAPSREVSEFTEAMHEAAMKKAVEVCLIPKYAIGEETYLKHWRDVEAIVRAAIAAASPSFAEAGGTIKEDLIVDQAQEDADTRASMDRMADLLTRTVNALRGDPGPLRRWSWHDLPERAAEAVNARNGAQAENEDLKGRLARAGVEIRNELRKQGWRQVEPNPAAWRWLPSPHWSEHIIAQDPNRAEEAKTYGMKVEALVVIKESEQ